MEVSVHTSVQHEYKAGVHIPVYLKNLGATSKASAQAG
jgi:hypothetical protein